MKKKLSKKWLEPHKKWTTKMLRGLSDQAFLSFIHYRHDIGDGTIWLKELKRRKLDSHIPFELI